MFRKSTCPVLINRLTTVVQRGSIAVDPASLAVVRIAVGLVAAVSMIRMWWMGWLDRLIINPVHHLRYPGLEWVPIPSPAGTRLVALLAVAAALATAFGWRTRWAASVFIICFGWIETIEATTYLNHYWLLLSLFVVVAVVPSDAAWSLAALHRGARSIPLWCVWALRCQVGLVYAFAGLAKLHRDWVSAGTPLRIWLPSRSDLPFLGHLLERVDVAIAASIAGAVFDLSVLPLLLIRRTRRWAFAALVVFHVATAMLIPSIGLFPVLMTIAATVFFEPSWPRRLVAGRPRASMPLAPRTAGPSSLSLALIGCWIALQLVLPLRHWWMPGDARWTGEGYRLAWNVVAVEKTGSVSFRVEGIEGVGLVNPADWFTPSQVRAASSEPDLIVQMAGVIAADFAADGQMPEITADAWVSLNGREAVRLLDGEVDLARIEASEVGAVMAPPPPRLGW